MIWAEELSASLDQALGVVVFHRVEVTHIQQLALTLAERINAMVEQNEKTIDAKLGGTPGWTERGDGGKGDKRGEQAQERKGRSERTRGGAAGRGKFHQTFDYSMNSDWHPQDCEEDDQQDLPKVSEMAYRRRQPQGFGRFFFSRRGWCRMPVSKCKFFHDNNASASACCTRFCTFDYCHTISSVMTTPSQADRITLLHIVLQASECK